MFLIFIEINGVETVIKSLKHPSAIGYDATNSILLKSTSCSSIIPANIFQQPLDEGPVPINWKIRKVIPLYKSGNKHSLLNYRLTSLASILCKILEHILIFNLARFLEKLHFLIIAVQISQNIL